MDTLRQASPDLVDTPPSARRTAAPALRDIPRSAPAGFDLEALRMLVLDLQQKLAALDARVGALHGMQTRAGDQLAERVDWLEEQVSAVATTVDELFGEADDRTRRDAARSMLPSQD